MSLSEEYLKEVRERVGAATEGPWVWASHTTADGDEWAVFDPADHALASNRDGWAPDAEFIAHARSDVPVLVAEVERLRSIITGQIDAACREWLEEGDTDALARAEHWRNLLDEGES